MELAQIDVAGGLVVIIAFLLGMGVPYPGRFQRKERRNGTPERRRGTLTQLDEIRELLVLLTSTVRDADTDQSEDPGGGRT